MSGNKYPRTKLALDSGDNNPDSDVTEANPLPVTFDSVSVKTPVFFRASDDVPLPSDSLAQVLAYNGDGTLLSVTVVYLENTYVQTYTYTDGKVTGISQWVKQ